MDTFSIINYNLEITKSSFYVTLFAIRFQRKLEILSVSYDDNKEIRVEAIEKDQLTWLNVSNLEGWNCFTRKLYCISGVPSNFLLDKRGRIIAKNLKGEALKEKLAELLN